MSKQFESGRELGKLETIFKCLDIVETVANYYGTQSEGADEPEFSKFLSMKAGAIAVNKAIRKNFFEDEDLKYKI